MMKIKRTDEKRNAGGRFRKAGRAISKFARMAVLSAGLALLGTAGVSSVGTGCTTNSTQKQLTSKDGSTSDASVLDATVSGDASILDGSVSNDASLLDGGISDASTSDGAVDSGMTCGAAVHEESVTTEWLQMNVPYEIGGYNLVYKGVVNEEAVMDVFCAGDNSTVVTDQSLPLNSEVTIPLNNGMQLTITVHTANENFMVISGAVSVVL